MKTHVIITCLSIVFLAVTAQASTDLDQMNDKKLSLEHNRFESQKNDTEKRVRHILANQAIKNYDYKLHY